MGRSASAGVTDLKQLPEEPKNLVNNLHKEEVLVTDTVARTFVGLSAGITESVAVIVAVSGCRNSLNLFEYGSAL